MGVRYGEGCFVDLEETTSSDGQGNYKIWAEHSSDGRETPVEVFDTMLSGLDGTDGPRGWDGTAQPK
jgi:hypothetical protein